MTVVISQIKSQLDQFEINFNSVKEFKKYPEWKHLM